MRSTVSAEVGRPWESRTQRMGTTPMHYQWMQQARSVYRMHSHSCGSTASLSQWPVLAQVPCADSQGHPDRALSAHGRARPRPVAVAYRPGTGATRAREVCIAFEQTLRFKSTQLEARSLLSSRPVVQMLTFTIFLQYCRVSRLDLFDSIYSLYCVV